MENPTLADIQARVNILFNGCSTGEEKEEADAWLRSWIFSDNVFQQCLSVDTQIASTESHSWLLFIMIKTLQERIRYFSQFLNPELLNYIMQWLMSIVNNYSALGESPHLRFSLITLSDILSLFDINIQDVVEHIPDNRKMLFFALFFEGAQESFVTKYKKKEERAQFAQIGNGINLLANQPMCPEWMRIFRALTTITSSELLLSLFPRLVETLSDVETIQILVDTFSDIYSGALSPNFMKLIIEFTVGYSQKLREMVEKEPKIHDMLFTLWIAFNNIDNPEILSENCVQLLNSALVEFFEATKIIQIDYQSWSELLLKSVDFFRDFQKHPLREFLYPLYQLCTYFCNKWMNDETVDLMTCNAILNLDKTSKEHLNLYLINEDPKTPGVILIAAANSESIDHTLLCQFCELVLSTTDFPSISCDFINHTFIYCIEYIPRFIQYLIGIYPVVPIKASLALLNMSKNFAQEFINLGSDIFNILPNLFKFGGTPSKANLIITNLNVIVVSPSPEVIHPILNTIKSYCVSFAVAVHTDIETYFVNFHKFIKCILKFSPIAPLLSEYYHNLALSMINALGEVAFVQNDDNITFFYLLYEKGFLNAGEVAEWANRMIDNGLVSSSLFTKIAANLPFQFLEKIIFFCNNFAIENDINMYTGIISVVCSVEDKNADQLCVFSPNLFFNIIKFASIDTASRAEEVIMKALKFPLSREICVAMLQGCVQKSFRCMDAMKRIIINILKMLIDHFQIEDYIQQFCAVCPEAVHPVAINFINFLKNSNSVLDIKNEGNRFIAEYTAILEK